MTESILQSYDLFKMGKVWLLKVERITAKILLLMILQDMEWVQLSRTKNGFLIIEYRRIVIDCFTDY